MTSFETAQLTQFERARAYLIEGGAIANVFQIYGILPKVWEEAVRRSTFKYEAQWEQIV